SRPPGSSPPSAPATPRTPPVPPDIRGRPRSGPSAGGSRRSASAHPEAPSPCRVYLRTRSDATSPSLCIVKDRAGPVKLRSRSGSDRVFEFQVRERCPSLFRGQEEEDRDLALDVVR